MADTKDYGPDPYVVDIEKDTLDNANFRTTRWTGKNIQLTLMSIPVGSLASTVRMNWRPVSNLKRREDFLQVTDRKVLYQ